jgi:pilus assembly protein CpaE
MRAVVVGDQPAMQKKLREAALTSGLQCGFDDVSTYGRLPARLSAAGADLVIVAANGENGNAAIRYAAHQQGLPVYAVGTSANSEAILSAIRQGARSFLDQERLPEDLRSAVALLLRDESASPESGRAIAVVGAGPGAGATTVAMNLAATLGARRKAPVALAELTDDAPAMAVALDVESPHDVLEIAQSWWRLDGAVLSQAAATKHAGMALFVRRADSQAAKLDGDAVRNTLRMFRRHYPLTVVDLGSLEDSGASLAATSADLVLVVMKLDVLSLRAARTLAADLERAGVEADRVRFLVNRYGEPGQLAWNRAQKLLGRKLFDLVPSAPGPVNRGLNDGKPAVRRQTFSRFTGAVERLATRLMKEVPCPQR